MAIFALASGCSQIAQQGAAESLGGTSWQLVKFQGGDDRVLVPDDKAKYTIAFGADGGVSVRIDCNRGRGTWKSGGRNQLEFGPLALTRAMCPPGSLQEIGSDSTFLSETRYARVLSCNMRQLESRV